MKKGFVLSVLVLFLGVFLMSFAVAAGSVSISYPLDKDHGGFYSTNISSIIWSYTGGNFTSDSECRFNGNIVLCSTTTLPGISIEGDNNWTISVQENKTSGSTIYSASVPFWVDSIAPNITLVNPTSTISYTSSNILTLIIKLTESNPAFYSSTKEIRRFFTYPESGSHSNDYDLDSNNNSDCSHNLVNPGDQQEGNYTYTIYAKDKYPNGTTIREITEAGVIIRDITPPFVTITTPTNNSNQKGTFSITSTATDLTSGVASILLNITSPAMSGSNSTSCSASSCNYAWDSSIIGEDIVYINATATDRAGNSNTTQIMINVDNLAPRITFDSPATGNYSTNQTVSISAVDAHLANMELYASKNGAGFERLNMTSKSPVTYTLSEGSWDVYGKANDTFGNTNQTETRKIIIDTTPPVTTDNAPAGWKNSSVSVTLTCVDNVGGVGCQITLYCIDTNNTCTPDTAGNIAIVSAEGINYVRYASNDSAGNQEAPVKSATVNIDLTPPTTAEDYDNTWRASDFYVNLTATDQVNLSGIASIYYNYNGAGWIKVDSASASVLINVEGNKTLQYYAVDNAGNVELTKTIDALLDKSGPLITLNVPNNNQPFANQTNVSFTYAASDSLSGVGTCFLILDGTEYGVFSSVLSPGKYSWKVRCTDAVGNNGTSETRSLTILEDVTLGSYTITNLSLETDITNVSFFFIGNEYGNINYTSSIDLSNGWNPLNFINISYLRISVDSSGWPQLNKPARITFYNVSGLTSPTIYINGAVCSSPACVFVSSTSDGNWTYDISGFSVYTIAEAPSTPSGGGGSSGGGGGSYVSPTNLSKNNTFATASNSGTENNTEEFENPAVASEQNNNPNSNSPITGGVIGTLGNVRIIIPIVFVVLLIALYLVARKKGGKEIWYRIIPPRDWISVFN